MNDKVLHTILGASIGVLLATSGFLTSQLHRVKLSTIPVLTAVDSLNNIISSKDSNIISLQHNVDSLNNIITINNNQITTLQNNILNIQQLNTEYKLVIKTIVGDDGFADYDWNTEYD